MKQLIGIVLISILLVGCQTKQQPVSQNSVTPTTQITIAETKRNEEQIEEQAEEEVIYGENGLPPLNEVLLNLYQEAYVLYENYYMCGFKLDYNQKIVANELTYYQVKEDNFSTLEKLEEQLKLYFTGSTLDEILSQINYYFIEEDGVLYALDFGSSANLFYSGHVFQLVSESDAKIELKLIRYLAKEQEHIPERRFYTIPPDLEKYDIDEMPIVLEKEEAGWRFSEIHLVYK